MRNPEAVKKKIIRGVTGFSFFFFHFGAAVINFLKRIILLWPGTLRKVSKKKRVEFECY